MLDTDLAKVARGLGERMRSGVADAAERIYYAISTGTRIIKCPAEGATAEIDEWLAGLHMIKPAEASWPSADVGEDGGINPGTPIALFAYGSQEVSQCGGSSDEDGVPDEETRLLPVDPMLTPDATLEDLWNLHAGNRGAIDPDTMAYASPALSAADASAGVRYASTGYYGNRYGGWQPIAEFGDPDWCDDGLAGVRRIFRFTRLSDGHVVEYQDGNCAEPQVGGTYVLEYEEYYLVLVRTAPETYEVTRYEKSEWIEGPYNRGGRCRGARQIRTHGSSTISYASFAVASRNRRSRSTRSLTGWHSSGSRRRSISWRQRSGRPSGRRSPRITRRSRWRACSIRRTGCTRSRTAPTGYTTRAGRRGTRLLRGSCSVGRS